MKFLNLTLAVLAVCIFTACSFSGSGTYANQKFEEALSVGNLKEAEMHLKKITDLSSFRHCAGLLIEEYLSVDNLDRAIYVFENITGHCSMYELNYTTLYDKDGYTTKYAQKLYDALIKNARYDEAWEYHKISYDSKDYPGNAPDYFAYMCDVIIELCNAGKHNEAQQFIKQKSVWFIKNVDNHEYGKNYQQYRYEIMHAELNKVYDNAH